MECSKNNNCFVPINCGCDFGAKIFGSCNPANIMLDASKPETLNWTEISVPEILCVPNQKPDIEHIDQVYAKAEISCVKLLETPYLFEGGTYDVVTINATTGEIATIVAKNENVYIYSGNPNIPLITKPNEEGTCLTGRKLIVEGTLKQKVVYTADVDVQSVHSASYEIPFSAFIIPYAKLDPLGDPSYTDVTLVPAGTAEVGTVPTIIIAEDVDVFLADEINIEVDLCEDFCVDSFIEDIYITALDCRTIFKNVTLFLKAIPVPQCGEL